jgi:hypothetical protein
MVMYLSYQARRVSDHVYVSSSQESELSDICFLSGQESEWSCICVLSSQESEWLCICVLSSQESEQSVMNVCLTKSPGERDR